MDPSGRWRTLHTPHFRVHFRPVDREPAERTAREAERAWGLLATELRPPRGTVDVTLSDDIDISNGFTTVFPSTRITVLAAPLPELTDFDDWLRLVTTHELTHVFHLDRTKGWWRGLQSVFGRVPGLFPNEYQPSWVIEGLAVYYESRFTEGGRLHGGFHTQLIAAAAAVGRPRSPWNAVYFTRWPDGTAPYAYGSRFFGQLVAAAGDSAVPRFVERTSGQLIPYRVGRQVRRATGRDLGAVWDDALRATGPATGDSGRTLDGALWTEPVPRVSPGGARVAYTHDDGKSPAELWIVDVHGWRVLRRHRVNGLARYDWLGDTLEVTQLDFTDRWHIRSDRYAWLPDGRWRRVTRAARVTKPRGGGGMLAAIVLAAARNRPSLAGVDTAGALWGDVVPSPDGRWVAATRLRSGAWSLVRWPAATPDSVVTLVAAAGLIADPVWQGSAVLFVSERTGLPQVYRWSAAGDVRTLTAVPLGARAPAPLPDGTLLYTTLGPEGWTLARLTPPATPADTVAEPPARAGFDSAPPVPMRETGYALWPSLRPHFWLPLGLDAGAAGRFFGGLTGGSDAVGRYAYVADALFSADPLRADGYVALISHALGSPSLDLSGSSEWSLVGITRSGTVVSERARGAALGATLVARRWRSFASVRVAAEYEGRRFVANPDTALSAVCTGCSSRDRVGGSVTLRVGHLVSGPLAISPVGGIVWAGTYRRREQQGSQLWSDELRSRLALYQRAPGPPGHAHSGLALRLTAGRASGPIATSFGVGGVSSGVVDLGFGVTAGGARDFPVRGYAVGTLFGRRAATASLEYRVPLALVGQAVGHLPFGVDRLWLSVFGDVGDAWEPGEAARLHRLRSAGVELVADLTVSYDLPLGLRLGVAQPLADLPAGGPARPRAYAAVGSDF
ncbi:MAG: hypothetical protein AUH42_05750 [Gemmatimonadetes bacterium 13_1_40CM_70_11]|nr:MAG: hypothetical protein AUH42_05750 [Gemmatimonadetes bacterium 13_1_40CM_70_11]